MDKTKALAALFKVLGEYEGMNPCSRGCYMYDSFDGCSGPCDEFREHAKEISEAQEALDFLLEEGSSSLPAPAIFAS